MICIYKITSPSGKIYIGQTVNLSKRLSAYKSGSCKNQPKLFASFKKYGYENHVVEVLEQCDRDVLNEREVFFINQFNSFNTPFGLNLHSGGNANKKCSDETRAKISKAGKGRTHSEEWKMNMSAKMKGNDYAKNATYSEERRKKIAAITIKTFTGKKLSEEHRNKIGQGNKGKVRSEEERARQSQQRKGKQPHANTIAANIGRVWSEESLAKASAAKKGKVFSEEHKAKLKAAQQKFYASLSEEEKIKKCGIQKGKPRTEEERKKISEGMKKYKASKIIQKQLGLDLIG